MILKIRDVCEDSNAKNSKIMTAFIYYPINNLHLIHHKNINSDVTINYVAISVPNKDQPLA